MNNKLKLKSLLLFSFFLLSLVSQGNAQNLTVGVNVGDSFNFKITKNDFTSSTTKSYIQTLIDFYNVDELVVNGNYDFSSILKTLNETLVPSVGDVLGVTVTQLPQNDALSGKLNYTYGSTTKEILTGFMIGTPITITDWSFWNGSIYNLPSYITEGVLVPHVDMNSETFNASISITFNSVPSDLQSQGFNKLVFRLEAFYNATTGVANKESLSIELKNPSISIPIVQTFSFEKTTNPTTSDANNTSNNGSGPIPGFELIALVSGFVLLSGYYRLRKNN
jgi:hypothetical protein